MKNWKNILKLTGVSVVFAGFLILTLSANLTQKQTPTTAIKVEFAHPEIRFIDKETIQNLLQNDLDTIQGLRLKEIDLHRLEEEVEASEYVDNCEAFINSQKQLQFRVTQKQALFRVLHDNGVSYYVDNMGIKFPKSHKFTMNVPVATGHIVYDADSLGVQRSRAINDLVKLFTYAKANEAVHALITSVNVEPNGDLLMTPRMGKHQVNLGSPVNLDDKFRRLTIFYKEGLNKIGWDNYSQVSVKYKDQIIAKKKEL